MKLLERPGKLVPLGVGIDEVEELEITLRVADDAVEIVDLKQAQVAVIILNAFLLKFGALFRRQLAGFAACFRPGGTQLMIGQKRFATMRSQATGPAGQLHLQHAELDAERQCSTPI